MKCDFCDKDAIGIILKSESTEATIPVSMSPELKLCEEHMKERMGQPLFCPYCQKLGRKVPLGFDLEDIVCIRCGNRWRPRKILPGETA